MVSSLTLGAGGFRVAEVHTNGIVSRHTDGAVAGPNGGTLQLALSNSFMGFRDAVIRFRMR